MEGAGFDRLVLGWWARLVTSGKKGVGLECRVWLATPGRKEVAPGRMGVDVALHPAVYLPSSEDQQRSEGWSSAAEAGPTSLAGSTG